MPKLSYCYYVAHRTQNVRHIMRPILASLIAATALCSWGQTTTQRINKTTTISVSTTLPSGQAFGVKGIAADVSGTGEPFATIRTYLLPDTIKPAVVSVTAEDGAFEQQLKKPGQYRLTIHSVGRSPTSPLPHQSLRSTPYTFRNRTAHSAKWWWKHRSHWYRGRLTA